MSIMASSNITALPKFNGKNYMQWKIMMKPILVSKDLYNFVEHGYVVPIAVDPIVGLTTTQQQTLHELVKKDNEAIIILHQAIEAHIFPRISNANTSKEI